MSAEKIIEQIKKDVETEIKQIQKEAEKNGQTIILKAKEEAKEEADKILKLGENQAENLHKIIISKENQNNKRKIMNFKEEIINECFVKAHQKFSTVKGKVYEDTISKYIQKGVKKLDNDCSIQTSRSEDKNILEKLGLKTSGNIEASGGIKILSKDGKIILDYTFDGILKRDRNKIRNKIGKLLFSK